MNNKIDFNDSGVLPLKIGSSFSGSKMKTLHSVEYDFMPQSVNVNKNATFKVGQNNDITAILPHVDSAEIPQTEFHGSQKSHKKECVLIIDTVTGEVTLERLSADIQLKRRNFHKEEKMSSGQTLKPIDGDSDHSQPNSPPPLYVPVTDVMASTSTAVDDVDIATDRRSKKVDKKKKKRSNKHSSDVESKRNSLPALEDDQVPMTVKRQEIVNNWIEQQGFSSNSTSSDNPFEKHIAAKNVNVDKKDNAVVEYMSDSNSSSPTSFHTSDEERFDNMKLHISENSPVPVKEKTSPNKILNEDLCLSESSGSGSDSGSNSDSNSNSNSETNSDSD